MSQLETDHDDEERAAPEGSLCAAHPERPALATCPRCGSYACIECWHHAHDRCHACLMRDPQAAAPPLPWEEPGRNVVSRFFGTLASAFAPTLSAPAMARDEIAPALRFAALTLLPLGALSGLIPYTHYLMFGPSFEVSVTGIHSGPEIYRDVANALGIGLLLTLFAFMATAFPYISLSRSFAEPAAGRYALRAMLYRGWLLALAPLGLLMHLAFWGMPEGTTEAAYGMVGVFAWALPFLLVFSTLSRTARLASGIGPLMSFVLAIVPTSLCMIVWMLVQSLIMPWAPAISAG